MKTIRLLFLATTLIFSACGDKEENLIVLLEDPSMSKVIERAFIAVEKPLIKTSTEFFVGLRYNKTYTETDQVTLSVNGQTYPSIAGPSVNTLTGTNYHYKIPGIATPGNYEILVTIRQNQNTTSFKRKIRVVSNLDVDGLWTNLDNEYVMKESFPVMQNPLTIDFNPTLNGSLGFQLNLGDYYQVKPAQALGNFVSFSPGLNGQYYIEYDNSKNIQFIRIIHGNPILTQGFTYQKIVDEVTAVYGAPSSVTTDVRGKKVTNYLTTKCKISVYEELNSGRDVATLITAK